MLTASLAQAQVTIASTYYSEDFEGGSTPAGWTIQTSASDGGWLYGDAAFHSSAYAPIPTHTNFMGTNDDACNCDKSSDRLISPAYDFTGISAPVLVAEVWFGGFTYDATEEAFVEVSTDGGATFTVVEQLPGDGLGDWYEIVVDLSDYAGMSGVHVVFRYADNGGWLYAMGVDDFRIVEPIATDVAGIDITFNSYVVAGDVPIEGQLQNLGGETITSMDLNYSVDGGAPVTESLTGLSIPFFEFYDFSHSTLWTAVAGAAARNIEVWATNINGNVDGNMANDRVSEDIYAVAAVTDRFVIFEHFTSSNCPPCGTFNPPYEALLDNNSDKTLNVSYHVWWPADTDPMYNFYPDAALERVDYYGNVFAPWTWMDGADAGGLPAVTQDVIDVRADFPAIYQIDATAEVALANNELTITGTVTSLADYWISNATVHVVVMEEFIPGPNPDPFPNTETEFHHVVRQMLPSELGTTVTALTASATQDINLTWSIPAEVDPLEVIVAIFVQENVNKEVMQGASVYPTFLPVGLDDEQLASDIQLFPNPATDQTSLRFSLTEANTMNITVVDATGRLMQDLGQELFPAGQHNLEISTADLAAGMYMVVLQGENGRQTQRLNIVR
jgi:hypothetical protein